MSATAWSPVRRTRSSACPQATLTLQATKKMQISAGACWLDSSPHLHRVEEIGSSLTALERLWDQLVVGREVGPAVDARVRPVGRRQVGLERLDHLAGFLACRGACFGRANFVLETWARTQKESSSGKAVSVRFSTPSFCAFCDLNKRTLHRRSLESGKNLSFNCCLGWCLLFDSVTMFNFQFLDFFVVFFLFTHCG